MSYEKPLVSVHMITYNHEKFIAQAIEGVLMQKTDFPFELIIGEDCSTDRTREIVVDYANRYPEIIKPILHEKNVGAKANSKSVREACTGKYVAVCEGDDYWIDPLKLQKQVDFMESHPNFSMCFHRAKKVDVQGKELGTFWPKKSWSKRVTGILDLLNENYISTQTVLYRNYPKANSHKSKLSDGLFFGDWALHFVNAEKGDIFFFDEVMAAYRVTDQGATNSTPIEQKATDIIEFYERIRTYFGDRISEVILNNCRNRYVANLASMAAAEGNFELARELLNRVKKEAQSTDTKTRITIAKAQIAVNLPKLYSALRYSKQWLIKKLNTGVRN